MYPVLSVLVYIDTLRIPLEWFLSHSSSGKILIQAQCGESM